MAYIKQNFEDGQTLKAEHLNAMEQGIADVSKHIVVSGGDTLTWDGNTDGLETLGGMHYKVSDVVVTKNDLVNGFTFAMDGIDEPLTIASWDEIASSGGEATEDGFVWIEYVILVPYDGYVDSIGSTYPKAGVYFIKTDSTYITSLTIPGYTGFITEKLDPKVLPDALQFGDELVEIMPETEVTGEDDGYGGYLATVAEANILAGGENLVIKFDGVEYECAYFFFDEYGYYYGNAGLLGVGEDNGIPFILGVSAASVMIMPDGNTHMVGISSVVTKKLNNKYVDTRKEFYIGSGEYIYTDISLTNKATKTDVITAAEDKDIWLVLAMENTPAVVTKVLSVPVTEQSDFRVYAIDPTTGTIKAYRTAEYTG